MTSVPPTLGLIINPTAGHGRGRSRGEQVTRELARRGYPVTNYTSSDPDTAFAAARAGAGAYDALIVVGGDGMAHMGINLVAGTPTALGLIAVGSGNDFARHLGLPIHDVPSALEAVLAAWEAGPTPIDAMRLTPDPGHVWAEGAYPGTHRWAGCVVSAGFDSMVTARANGYSWPRGMGRYLRAVLYELRRFAPYPYRVTIDGAQESFRGTLVAVANAPSFGGGMKIAPAARANSGTLEVVIAGDVSRIGLLRVFPRVYAGTHVTHPAVRVRPAHEVSIEADTTGIIPHIFADGELVGTAPVRAVVHAGAVNMLCPRLGA